MRYILCVVLKFNYIYYNFKVYGITNVICLIEDIVLHL